MDVVHALILTTAARTAWFEVLRAALVEFHPDVDVRAVRCDPRHLSPPGPTEITLDDVEFAGLRYADLAMVLGARDAGWASLPAVIERLAVMPTPTEPLLVLSDTSVVLGPLDDWLAGLAEHPVLARSVRREPRSGLGWGGALPGALVIGGGVADLSSWWTGRVVADLHAEPGESQGLDGLWRDLSAVAHCVTDPTLRLSPRNSDEVCPDPVGADPVAGDAPVAIDGRRLCMADVDGFDPARPWWFAPSVGDPRRAVSSSSGLRRFTHLVADRLIAEGWSDDVEPEAIPGVASTAATREWYRLLLDGDDPVPNPYVSGQVAAYLDLLSTADGSVTGVSRFADHVVAERPDLAAAFPAIRWSDRDPFIRWLWTHGLDEGVSSLALLPDLPRAAASPPVVSGPGVSRPFGVNLVGYLTGDLGLGVAARRMRAALESAGVPVATVAYDRTASRQSGRSTAALDAPYEFNLLVITPDQLPYFVDDVGLQFFEGHHNIGLWYWETDVMTDRQTASFDLVDEVWGATQYLCDVFAAYDRVPVTLVPVPLVFEDPELTEADRDRLGLDDRFTVLFSFDFLSVAARKNPLGLLQAYAQAFDPGDGARLVLKGINGEQFPEVLEELLDASADRPDVDVWDRYLSGRDRLALVAAVDCYASLHRSEGLGLTMAEAMALGTPVVATGYSGNLDFMDDRSALLVPYEEVVIGEGHLYPAEGHWADPDLDEAARLLRRLRDEPALAEQLATQAVRSLEPFSVERVGAIAAARLSELTRSR